MTTRKTLGTLLAGLTLIAAMPSISEAQRHGGGRGQAGPAYHRYADRAVAYGGAGRYYNGGGRYAGYGSGPSSYYRGYRYGRGYGHRYPGYSGYGYYGPRYYAPAYYGPGYYGAYDGYPYYGPAYGYGYGSYGPHIHFGIHFGF